MGIEQIKIVSLLWLVFCTLLEKNESRKKPNKGKFTGKDILKVADNSFYQPASAILTVTDQTDSRYNVKTVLPIINTLILLENDQQLLSQS